MRKVGRVGAVGLVAGPVAFVGAWVLAARGIAGYSYVRDAISRTAAVDAPDRGLMTAGFLTYSVGVGLGALALREALPGRAWVAAAVSAAGTAGVALAPLDVSDTVDTLHGVAATIGYAGLAATPLLAARPLADAGATRAAKASITMGVVIAAALAATVVASDASGLAQRVGLTTGDAWLIAAGATLLGKNR